jgi:D-glycero-alpha-D-manno-heptose-7-phosphate kinase
VTEDPGTLRIVTATAPIRICDIGSWTDTWFAGHGKVFNIGVSPPVGVRIAVGSRGQRDEPVVLAVENFDERYSFSPEAGPGRHPLLEAIVTEVGIPEDISVDISIASDAPAGSSTGTSAAAAVALIGALDALTPGRMPAEEVASLAHHVETARLGVQSGVQDQLCAAFGGINFIEIDPYPRASVSQLLLDSDVRTELNDRLVLVFLGRSHVSSDAHDRVIGTLADQAQGSVPLEELRSAAEEAKDALTSGDFPALGRAMVRNTDAQGRLHPALIGRAAQTAIDVARAHRTPGWKVNGAGGEGGSITLLCGTDQGARRALLSALAAADPSFRVVPTRLSGQGLSVRVSRPDECVGTLRDHRGDAADPA